MQIESQKRLKNKGKGAKERNYTTLYASNPRAGFAQALQHFLRVSRRSDTEVYLKDNLFHPRGINSSWDLNLRQSSAI